MNYLKSLILRLFPLYFLFFLFAVPGFAASLPVDFFGARAFGNGGTFYYEMKEGDFNGDGKIDVLTSSYNEILVFYGDGSGGFSQPPTVAYSSSSGEIFSTAGDFNNDGRSDFAFASRDYPPSIVVVFGNADKTFSQPIYSAQNPLPTTVVPVDFDNDGKLDLLGQAQTTSGDNVIAFYKGGGNGTFVVSGQVNTTYAARNIRVGDFNNDGWQDISYGDSDKLQIVQNTGNGSFGTPKTIDTIDYGFASRVIADVNNDGKNDLIAAQNTFFNPVVAVWLGNGDFTFTQAPDFIVPINEFSFLHQIADVNNDKKPDLIFSSRNQTIIINGFGDGTFAEADSYVDGGGGSLIVRDLNGDNWLDIVAAQSFEFRVSGAGSFSVLMNLQNGSFLSAPALDTGNGTKDIAVADFNGDGLKDFVVVNRGGGGGEGDIIIVTQTTASKFVEKPAAKGEKLLGDAGIDPATVITGDFNRDNKPDIFVAGHAAFGAGRNALMLINQGNDDFTPTFIQIGTGDIYNAAAADFNSDGKLDLVTTSFQGISISFGMGNGTFTDPVNYLTGIPSNQLAIGDFNDDAKADLAVINYTQSKIQLLINNGEGAFTVGAKLNIDIAPSAVAAADMNSDGKTDLIVSKGNGVSVLTGNGDAAFNAEISYPITPFSASDLTIADFNGDGKNDVALLGGTNAISILLNDGAGRLNNETLWGGGAILSAIVSDDFNNDGKTDLIFGFTSSSNGYTKILFNATEKQTTSRRVLFDFDGDGKADVSVFRPENGVWYLLNSQSGFNAAQFGVAADKLVPADYDGDGRTDVAVYRSGTWYLNRSTAGFTGFAFGAPDDIPQPADFDGDGKAELAVWRPSNGVWYVYNLANNQFSAFQFGAATDKPVAADYDGDGKADYAVFRPSNGTWYLQRSRLGFTGVQFGDASDKPTPADYDGDGKTDIAVFRPANGSWYMLGSTAGFSAFQFGISTDLPAAADYDGDGKADIAVFRNGIWYIQQTTAGFTGTAFGAITDKPVPNAFVQ